MHIGVRRVLVVLSFLVVLPLALLTASSWLSALGWWLAVSHDEHKADAIVVLSGGGPERLTQGITLYKQGLAPQLWYTGDAPTAGLTTFTDAQFARQFAIEQGVPKEAIYLLTTTSTWEDGREIATRVKQEGIGSILLVTDWYHGRRAVCAVRQQLAGTGVATYYSPTPATTYGPNSWWRNEDGLVTVANELIKSTFYRLNYGLTAWQCDQLAYSLALTNKMDQVTPLAAQWAVLGALGCLLAYLVVAGLRVWAVRRQVFDIPNDRSSHSQPTPRGGGLAIVAVTLLGLAAWAAYNTGGLGISLLIYVASGTLIALVSWVDDLRSLPNRVRFATHGLGALLSIWVFGSWSTLDIPLVGTIYLGWVGLLVTFLWIVGLTNAYNFMDGIDGMAGSQAVVAGLGWAVLGLLSGQMVVGVIGLLLAASSLGFLGHNWPPARIFMGDVGSAFLGYTFAVLPLAASQSDSRLAVAGVLLVWPFLFDALFTFVRRLRKRENVFAAHRSHLYQRLVIAGYSHRRVTLIYISLEVIGALLALAWYGEVLGSEVAVALLLPVLCLGLWSFVVREERRRALRTLPGAGTQLGVLGESN